MELGAEVLLICGGFLLFAILVGMIGKKMTDSDE